MFETSSSLDALRCLGDPFSLGDAMGCMTDGGIAVAFVALWFLLKWIQERIK